MAKPFEISKKLVWQAYLEVKSNGGAAGVDKQSIEAFEQNLKNNLYQLWNRLSSGSYFPPAVKAVSIRKKSGGIRILGVPTVSDRIAQTVVKLVLEPILEPVFDEDSYGYRPGRSALGSIWNNINRYLIRWVCRKFKRFFRQKRRARRFLDRFAHAHRDLFIHWRLGVFPLG